MLASFKNYRKKPQPPSRGCELKFAAALVGLNNIAQPPSRGCELKYLNGASSTKQIASRLRAAVS